ncbi:MAG: hypothetical protein U5R49_20320 [Deltaproteobacteria bacterium]|nr:hypothetical protein [Deltaproteobacteria bacterium]
MTIDIDNAVLEKACKEIIESILICLPNAFKGTVYRIGRPPEMIAKRITSGEIDREKDTITWGLPEESDYNPPGKSWLAYRDEPVRPLEAMGWCVERQKSWTAEDPGNDARSVRLQVEGIMTDYHHMEPVLIRKEDLPLPEGVLSNVPRNYHGEGLWEDSDYIVAAVIKIHFLPQSIKIGSPETRIIKRLSRVLGTELLSYELKQQSLEATRLLAEDRFKSYNILADSLRNAITKSGLIFSLMKLEFGFLRDQWEAVLLKDSDLKEKKRDAVRRLNTLAGALPDDYHVIGNDLIALQDKFLKLRLPPRQGENWIRMQIEQKWNTLIHKGLFEEERNHDIRQEIEQLKRSLALGKDQEILRVFDSIPEPLKREWVDLLYSETDRFDLEVVERLIQILDDSYLDLPYKDKSRKTLTRLKALAEIMGQLEQSTDTVLHEVLNGHGHQPLIMPMSQRAILSR